MHKDALPCTKGFYPVLRFEQRPLFVCTEDSVHCMYLPLFGLRSVLLGLSRVVLVSTNYVLPPQQDC